MCGCHNQRSVLNPYMWSPLQRVGGDPANEAEDGNNSPMIAPHTGSPAITVPMGNAGKALVGGGKMLHVRWWQLC
jgi:hypothetical protein